MKKKRTKNSLTDKQMMCLIVFKKKMCNIKQTCVAVGISRSTFYNWLDKLDTFKKEIEEIRENLFDDIESVLYEKIFIHQDTTCLIYFARTRMKHRGYTEKQVVKLDATINANCSCHQYKHLSNEELNAKLEEYQRIAKLSG